MSGLNIIVGKKEHTLELIDNGSGVEIEFTYRLPSNKERVRFQNQAVQIRGRKTVIKNQEAALKLVKPLIKSFRFPQEEVDTHIRIEKDGQFESLSCNTQDPGYHEAWREVLAKGVPGMLETLGLRVFSGVTDADSNVEFGRDDDDAEDGEEEAPAPPTF